MPTIGDSKTTTQSETPAGFNTTSTSFVDVTGITVTLPTRSRGKAFITYNANYRIDAAAVAATIESSYNSVSRQTMIIETWSASTRWNSVAISGTEKLTGAVFKIQAKTVSNTFYLAAHELYSMEVS